MSVIVPLYNAEKYIGDCLTGILAQTFTDYEVIVVDDCSTDSSVAIVENYIPKFGGRLKLYHMEKNSGTPGLPRNRGLMLSRGEYIFFLDSDDKFAVANALELMFFLARRFDADLVHFTKNYETDAEGNITKISINASLNPSDKVIIYEDLSLRFREVIAGKIWFAPWRYFIKRDLILEHELFFPTVGASEDQLFFRCILFFAKKFLCVPNIVYIHQNSPNSIVRSKKDIDGQIKYIFESVIFGLNFLEQAMNKIEFFRLNPKYSYAVLNQFVFQQYRWFLMPSEKYSAEDIYESIKRIFKCKLGEHDVLIAALCTMINTQQKFEIINNQKFQQFAAQAQARITQLETQLKTK